MPIPSLGELKDAVEKAGRHIRENFGLPHTITHKADDTPVTEIDYKINSELAQFASRYGIGFLGEEGNGNEEADTYLFVDPLDGTGAFMRGMATCTVIASIMKMEEGRGVPIMAVIHNPITKQMWVTKLGGVTQYFSIKEWLCISPASVATHLPKYWRTSICMWPGVDQPFADFQKRVVQDRNFSDQQMGAFGIGGGLISSGLIHATAISATSAVETAAMSLLVKNAGGVAIDLLGNPLESFEFGDHKGKKDFLLPHGAIMACNKEVAWLLKELYVA